MSFLSPRAGLASSLWSLPPLLPLFPRSFSLLFLSSFPFALPPLGSRRLRPIALPSQARLPARIASPSSSPFPPFAPLLSLLSPLSLPSPPLKPPGVSSPPPSPRGPLRPTAHPLFHPPYLSLARKTGGSLNPPPWASRGACGGPPYPPSSRARGGERGPGLEGGWTIPRGGGRGKRRRARKKIEYFQKNTANKRHPFPSKRKRRRT